VFFFFFFYKDVQLFYLIVFSFDCVGMGRDGGDGGKHHFATTNPHRSYNQGS